MLEKIKTEYYEQFEMLLPLRGEIHPVKYIELVVAVQHCFAQNIHKIFLYLYRTRHARGLRSKLFKIFLGRAPELKRKAQSVFPVLDNIPIEFDEQKEEIR